MERLKALIGREVGIPRISDTLHDLAREMRAPVVGALHVTCADESEKECVQAFDQSFTGLLPDLKFGQQSHFRISNLGARYEPGSVRIAEEHFAISESAQEYKLMVVKINSHVSAVETPQGVLYGTLQRYGKPSSCCGALAGLLKGASGLPFLDELAAAFTSGGLDRIALLRDEKLASPEERMLLAALVNARLQAKRAVEDLGGHRPETPTLYLVLPCVTINLAGEDREILCGVYRADHRGDPVQVDYQGLGDHPAHLKLNRSKDGLSIRGG